MCVAKSGNILINTFITGIGLTIRVGMKEGDLLIQKSIKHGLIIFYRTTKYIDTSPLSDVAVMTALN